MPPVPLSSCRVVVTGDIPGLTREGAQGAVRALGGTSVSSVNASTSLIVVGEGAGLSKLAKAAQFRVRHLTADQFLLLVAAPQDWDGLPVGAVPDDSLETDSVVRRAPLPASLHAAGESSWARAGTWVVVMQCVCGHVTEAARRADAHLLHLAHRQDAGDPGLDMASSAPEL